MYIAFTSLRNPTLGLSGLGVWVNAIRFEMITNGVAMSPVGPHHPANKHLQIAPHCFLRPQDRQQMCCFVVDFDTIRKVAISRLL